MADRREVIFLALSNRGRSASRPEGSAPPASRSALGVVIPNIVSGLSSESQVYHKFKMRYSLVWFTKPKKFISKKLQFIVIGKELTKAGRVHYQGYAELNRKLSFKQLKRLFGRTCHIEVAKKSAIHNIAYCCKDGSIYHLFGSPSEQRAAHLLAHFSNSQKVKDAQNKK